MLQPPTTFIIKGFSRFLSVCFFIVNLGESNRSKGTSGVVGCTKKDYPSMSLGAHTRKEKSKEEKTSKHRVPSRELASLQGLVIGDYIAMLQGYKLDFRRG